MTAKTPMTQSRGVRGQRFWTFVFVVLAMNATAAIAAKLTVPVELAADVIWATMVMGLGLVLGRSGVHIAETLAAGKAK